MKKKLIEQKTEIFRIEKDMNFCKKESIRMKNEVTLNKNRLMALENDNHEIQPKEDLAFKKAEVMS